MAGHHRGDPGLDRSAERHEVATAEDVEGDVEHGELAVGVGARRAVAGEVLRAGRHAATLEPADGGGHVASGCRGVAAEAADADHRVGGIGVDVGDRGEVEVDPRRRQLDRQGVVDGLGQSDVVDGAEGSRAGCRTTGRGVQPGDVAAFLVDGHDDRAGVMEDGRCRRRGVGGGVVGEEADAAEAGLDPAQHPRRRTSDP